MSITELLIACAVLIGIFFLGFLAGIDLNLPIFKRIISGPIQSGNLNGRYVVEGLDGNIHYVRPPFTLTLD